MKLKEITNYTTTARQTAYKNADKKQIATKIALTTWSWVWKTTVFLTVGFIALCAMVAVNLMSSLGNDAQDQFKVRKRHYN